MPTTMLSGLVDEQDVLSNEKVVDMDNEIRMLDPDQSQFSTMLMKVSSRDAINPKVEWLEDQLNPRTTTLAASATSATTSLSVAASTGQYFRAGDIVRVPNTGEAVKVASVATDTLGVTRAIGATAAASAASGVQVVIVGNASAEGATLGTRLITKKVAGYNYCQILRHPFGFTNTYTESKLYGGSQPAFEAVKKGVEHKRAIESTFFFGARSIDTSGSTPVRTSGGLVEFIATNINNPAGSLTHALLDTYLETALAHGEIDSKVLFCAPRVATAISGFLKTAWAPPTVSERLFGAKVDGYISGTYGVRLPVIVKREWNDQSTASTQYGGWAFLVDLSYVKARPLRTTRFLRNRQANDADETTHEYLTEISLQVAQESCHALIKGVTG